MIDEQEKRMQRQDWQKELLSTLMDAMKEKLLQGADDWPEEWDGIELRELIYNAADWERSGYMCDKRRKRANDFHNVWVTKNLY